MFLMLSFDVQGSVQNTPSKRHVIVTNVQPEISAVPHSLTLLLT